MLPTLNIGSFVFPTAGLVYIFGTWLGLSLVERTAKKIGVDAEVSYGLAVTAVLVGFIGARLTFVVQYWPAFQESPLNIIWPLTSGFNIAGGLFFGVAGGFFYGRYKQVSWPITLDALVPGMVFGLMIVSLADFLAGPGLGTLTSIPWGISQYGIRRHPVQIYELLVGAAALLVWWRTIEKRTYAGQLFLLTTAVYAAGRLFTDAFRDNAWTTNNGLHIVQIICFVIVIICLFFLGLYSEREMATIEEKQLDTE